MKTVYIILLCIPLGLLGCDKSTSTNVNAKQLVVSFDIQEDKVTYQWSFLPSFSSVEMQNIQLGGQDYQGTIIKGLSQKDGKLAIGEPATVFYERRIGADLDIYILSSVQIHLEYSKDRIKIYDIFNERQLNGPVLDLPLGIYRFRVAEN